MTSAEVEKEIENEQRLADRMLQQAAHCSNAIESKISGEFSGWEGETIFNLMNGQIWQQSSYAYKYKYAFMPEVLIFLSNGRCKMKVDGINEFIFVQRLK